MNILRKGSLLVLSVAISVSRVSAEDFTSCAAVRKYFTGTHAAMSYEKVRSLQRVVIWLESSMADPSTQCEDWLVERAFFEYATELHRYSTTFSGDPEATRKWATDAFTAYNYYLEWFIGLGEGRQTALIRRVAGASSSSPEEFKKTRRNWLRQRVGNAVQGLGASLVIARDQEHLLTSYEVLCARTVDIFPNEAAVEWYHWLTAQPDFRINKPDSRIRDIIARSADCAGHWAAFRGCLEQYIPANPSVAQQWVPIKERIALWLPH